MKWKESAHKNRNIFLLDKKRTIFFLILYISLTPTDCVFTASSCLTNCWWVFERKKISNSKSPKILLSKQELKQESTVPCDCLKMTEECCCRC